jgi:hypothetical protein
MTEHYEHPEYPRAKRPKNPTEAAATVAKLRHLADVAGVKITGLDQTEKRIAAAGDIRAEASQYAEDRETFRRRIAQSLAEGGLTLTKAAEEAVKNQSLQHGGIVWQAAQDSEGLAVQFAFDRLTEASDKHKLLAALKASVTKTLDAIRAHRETLDGITTADQAMAAGETQAKAWNDYANVQIPRWYAAVELADLTRDYHLIPPLPRRFQEHPHTPPLKARFGNYRLRANDLAKAHKHGDQILELLDPICDEWLPGIWSEQEIIGHMHAQGYSLEEHRHVTPKPSDRTVKLSEAA